MPRLGLVLAYIGLVAGVLAFVMNTVQLLHLYGVLP